MSDTQTFQLTDEQQTICEAVRETSSHVMIDALAGTGKTETLCQAARGVRGFALALAFNKKIAEELTRRLPANFEAKTMNSLGFAELRRNLSSVTKWTIDDKKGEKILREQLKARGEGKLGGDQWSQTMELFRAAQLAGVDPATVGPTEPVWQDLAEDLWIQEDDLDEAIDRAFGLLVENNKQTERGSISFDDQLYWPVVYGTKFAKHEVVFGDEAQDWNTLQHGLVDRIAKGRLVVAGDPRQSIYGWRGARVDSMGELREGHAARPWVELGLTMTWRCPKEIVTRQLRHVPRYRASDDAIEGRIARLGGDLEGGRTTWGIRDLVELRPNERASLAVLCRNNAPLWKLAFALLRQRVSIVMQGRDLGKMLIALSRKIEPSDKASKEAFLRKLKDWEQTQMLKADEERTEAIADRAECLRVVADESRDAGEIRRAIEDLFSRVHGALTLSTIHRAKGLEWDVVMHLDPWRVPSKQSRKQGGEQLAQEYNLVYVAETRTKHTLVLANVEDFA